MRSETRGLIKQLSLSVIYGIALTLSSAFSLRAESHVLIPLALDFEVRKVVCAAQAEHGLVLVRALVRSVRKDVDGDKAERETLVVGCVFPDTIERSQRISLLLERSDEDTQIAEVPEADLLAFEESISDLARAREQLEERRGVLKRLQGENQAQHKALTRLRHDADLIVKQSGLRELEGQIQHLTDELSQLKAQRDFERNDLKSLSTDRPPHNAATREVELTKQLALFAEIAKNSEDETRNTVGSEEGAIPPLVEDVPNNDPQALHAELVKLRRRRQELEDSVAEKNVLDYE
jgi:hypothetical protein